MSDTSGPGCQPLSGDHMTVDQDVEYLTGTVLYVTCEDGYKTSGNRVLTCEPSGDWHPDPPTCQKEVEDGGGATNILIIAVCTVASVVAFVIIVCAAYMLVKNWQKGRRKQQDNSKQEILPRQFYAVSQDCVGMPALVYDNMDFIMTGKVRAHSDSTMTSRSSYDGPQSTSADGDSVPEKVFIY